MQDMIWEIENSDEHEKHIHAHTCTQAHTNLTQTIWIVSVTWNCETVSNFYCILVIPVPIYLYTTFLISEKKCILAIF